MKVGFQSKLSTWWRQHCKMCSPWVEKLKTTIKTKMKMYDFNCMLLNILYCTAKSDRQESALCMVHNISKRSREICNWQSWKSILNGQTLRRHCIKKQIQFCSGNHCVVLWAKEEWERLTHVMVLGALVLPSRWSRFLERPCLFPLAPVVLYWC